MAAYRDLLRKLGQYEWFARIAAKAAPLDAKIVRKTGGRFGLLGNYGLPQCLLTTIGRKSGQPRTVTLLYARRGDELILVGSNFGQHNDPAWALNLEADPTATVTIKERATRMTARQVTDHDEREAIWQQMYSIWPAYHAYRGRSGRDIKIFALTPAGNATQRAGAADRSNG